MTTMPTATDNLILSGTSATVLHTRRAKPSVPVPLGLEGRRLHRDLRTDKVVGRDADGNPVFEVKPLPVDYRRRVVATADPNWKHRGSGEPIPIPRERMKGWVENTKRMIAAGVNPFLPDRHRWDVDDADADGPIAAGNNFGKVLDAGIDGDAMYVDYMLVGERAQVADAANDVSVCIMDGLRDAKGNVYGESLHHLAIVHNPALPNLGPSVRVAASATGAEHEVPVTVLEAATPPAPVESPAVPVPAGPSRLSLALALAAAKDGDGDGFVAGPDGKDDVPVAGHAAADPKHEAVTAHAADLYHKHLADVREGAKSIQQKAPAAFKQERAAIKSSPEAKDLKSLSDTVYNAAEKATGRAPSPAEARKVVDGALAKIPAERRQAMFDTFGRETVESETGSRDDVKASIDRAAAKRAVDKVIGELPDSQSQWFDNGDFHAAAAEDLAYNGRVSRDTLATHVHAARPDARDLAVLHAAKAAHGGDATAGHAYAREHAASLHAAIRDRAGQRSAGPSRLALALCGDEPCAACGDDYEPDEAELPADFARDADDAPRSRLALALSAVVLALDCGANGPGGGGFQKGNTCGGQGHGARNGLRTSRVTLANVKAAGAKQTREYTDASGRKVTEYRTEDGRLFHAVENGRGGGRNYHQVHGERKAKPAGTSAKLKELGRAGGGKPVEVQVRVNGETQTIRVKVGTAGVMGVDTGDGKFRMESAENIDQAGWQILEDKSTVKAAAKGLTPAARADVERHLAAGNRIAAIRAYREATGKGLTEATAAVDDIGLSVAVKPAAAKDGPTTPDLLRKHGITDVEAETISLMENGGSATAAHPQGQFKEGRREEFHQAVKGLESKGLAKGGILTATGQRAYADLHAAGYVQNVVRGHGVNPEMTKRPADGKGRTLRPGEAPDAVTGTTAKGDDRAASEAKMLVEKNGGKAGALDKAQRMKATLTSSGTHPMFAEQVAAYGGRDGALRHVDNVIGHIKAMPDTSAPADPARAQAWRDHLKHATTQELRDYAVGGPGFGVEASDRPYAIAAAKAEQSDRAAGTSTPPASGMIVRPVVPTDARPGFTHEITDAKQGGRYGRFGNQALAELGLRTRQRGQAVPAHATERGVRQLLEGKGAMSREGARRSGHEGILKGGGFVVSPAPDGGVLVTHRSGRDNHFDPATTEGRVRQHTATLAKAGYAVERVPGTASLHVRGPEDKTGPQWVAPRPLRSRLAVAMSGSSAPRSRLASALSAA